jgi:hypothetical protein
MYNAWYILQAMTINIRFAFSIGNTTRAIYIEYQGRQTKLMTPNTICTIVKTSTLSIIKLFDFVKIDS